MCTNSRYIYNPYARRSILVKCGKCDACLQEKACARSNRIRNNFTSGTIALFCTFTYTNDFIPFVYRSDLMSSKSEIHVYRRSKGRFVYSKKNGLRFKKSPGISVIDSFFVPFEYRSSIDCQGLKSLVGLDSDKIGVCLNSDMQKFFKRLNQILLRDYNYDTKYSYFYCSELGSHTHRPHFHALIFIPISAETTFRHAIIKAWPYADISRTSKYIEVAKDAASYVSSYVNSHFSISSPLSFSKFKAQHNYSHGFGVFLDCFSLPSILQKIDQRDLHYYRQRKSYGVSEFDVLPVPKYVINRYFPYCKGFSCLSPGTLERILLRTDEITKYLNDGEQIVDFTTQGKHYFIPLLHRSYIANPVYNYSSAETYKIYVRIENAYKYFHDVTGLSRYDYVHYYMDAWQLNATQHFVESFKDISVIDDFSDFYENIYDMFTGSVHSPTLECLPISFQLDPNARKDVIEKTQTFTILYDKLDKQKKVTNYCMAQNGHYV